MNSSKFSKNKKTGFTLLELIIVIAIIGVLSSVVIVSVSNARSRARDTVKINELVQVRNALELYNSDNNRYPILTSVGSPTALVTPKPYIPSLPSTVKYISDAVGANYLSYDNSLENPVTNSMKFIGSVATGTGDPSYVAIFGTLEAMTKAVSMTYPWVVTGGGPGTESTDGATTSDKSIAPTLSIYINGDLYTDGSIQRSNSIYSYPEDNSSVTVNYVYTGSGTNPCVLKNFNNPNFSNSGYSASSTYTTLAYDNYNSATYFMITCSGLPPVSIPWSGSPGNYSVTINNSGAGGNVNCTVAETKGSCSPFVASGNHITVSVSVSNGYIITSFYVTGGGGISGNPFNVPVYGPSTWYYNTYAQVNGNVNITATFSQDLVQ